MDAYQQFKTDPQAYWQRQINAEIDEHILELREALRNAKPHQGHYALANLVKSRTIKSVITQNIDGLDIKAGIRDNLIEIHGNRSRLRCIGCGKRTDLNDFVPLFAPDPCDTCGKPVKFDAVMFGEPIPDDTMQAAKNQFERADCIIAIGTSATVRPASGLLWIAKHRSKGQHDPIKHHIPDAKLIEINPNNTKLTKICDVIIRATAKHALPQILKTLRQHPTHTSPPTPSFPTTRAVHQDENDEEQRSSALQAHTLAQRDQRLVNPEGRCATRVKQAIQPPGPSYWL